MDGRHSATGRSTSSISATTSRGRRQLGYDTVDVMGYSFGGGAALRLAVQHPEAVRRL